jgi:hypothetical protein
MSVLAAQVLDPVAVGLKFGFLAVLYLFLLWVSRSALRDLRGTSFAPNHQEATGLHEAGRDVGGAGHFQARLRVVTAAGLASDSAYDVSGGAVLGRGAQADIVLGDHFSSSAHARLVPQGEAIVLEDLGSTNGTFLNGEPLTGPQPLHHGDRIRIGDSEFTFER